MLFKESRVQLMAAMISIALPGTLQTTEGLRHKYGPPDAERYIVRPGIVMTVAFAKDGRPCEMVIEPRRSLVSTEPVSKPMPSDKVSEILNEVLPTSQRGRLLQDITFTGGCNSIRNTDYETVSISRTIVCPSGGETGESSVRVRFKKSQCQ
jgi:hypothetical protein